MADADLIQYEKDGDVALICLNDPDTLNSLSQPMTQALMDALDRAAGDARAVVLTGRGRGFSAGANLAASGMDITDPERDVGAQLETGFNPLILKMRELPVPIVTAVRGAAAGVGCSIALMGDVIIASEKAYFLQAFCNIGLIPDGGSPFILARAIGRVRAMEMMLLGERYPADRAYADGLVTRLVEDAELESTALDYGRRLAAGPTKALALIRRSAWAALESTLDEQLTRERSWQLDAGRTDDFVEGVKAFFEKREAKFQGR